ncbi:hypothetical protein BDW66DRAFT_54467 [Aspergillus desertorum]
MSRGLLTRAHSSMVLCWAQPRRGMPKRGLSIQTTTRSNHSCEEALRPIGERRRRRDQPGTNHPQQDDLIPPTCGQGRCQATRACPDTDWPFPRKWEGGIMVSSSHSRCAWASIIKKLLLATTTTTTAWRRIVGC